MEGPQLKTNATQTGVCEPVDGYVPHLRPLGVSITTRIPVARLCRNVGIPSSISCLGCLGSTGRVGAYGLKLVLSLQCLVFP